ncbi:MAG: hypothetical protein ACRDV9_08210, partial [Acidimicrobiia bacterium]
VGLVGALHSARVIDRAIDGAIEGAGPSEEPTRGAKGSSRSSSRLAPLSPETLDDRLAEAMSFLGLGAAAVETPDPKDEAERASHSSGVGGH